MCLLRGTCLVSCSKCSAAQPGPTRPHTQHSVYTLARHLPDLPLLPMPRRTTAQQLSIASSRILTRKRKIPSPSQANSSGRTVQRLQLTDTNSTQQNSSAEADSCSAVFVEQEGSLPVSGPYPDPDESTQQPPTSFNIKVSLMLLSILRST